MSEDELDEPGSDEVEEYNLADDEGAPTAVAVLEYLCEQIVTKPDDVDVQVRGGNDGRYELTVTVGEGDTGRVIGRRGRTANAIRTVVRAAAVKDGVEVDVEFAD